MLTVVDGQLGHNQRRRVRDAVGVGRRVEDLDVCVCAGYLDLHHGVGLGHTTVSSKTVPVGGTLSVKGVAVTVDYRHPKVNLFPDPR